MQRPSHVGEHLSINMSRLYSRGDISLKIRDQTGGVRVPAVGAVAQVLEQLLQQKQITKGKRLIVTAWRHVASDALEGDKDLARGAFEVLIELRRERRGPAFGDCSRNAPRVLIRRRGLWLGSAHHAASSNRAMLPSGPVSDSSKSVKSTTDFGAWELACLVSVPSIKFPVPRKKIPDTRLQIPCSVAQGICLEAIEFTR